MLSSQATASEVRPARVPDEVGSVCRVESVASSRDASRRDDLDRLPSFATDREPGAVRAVGQGPSALG